MKAGRGFGSWVAVPQRGLVYVGIYDEEKEMPGEALGGWRNGTLHILPAEVFPHGDGDRVPFAPLYVRLLDETTRRHVTRLARLQRAVPE